MGLISIGGLGSGLDVQGIVEALVNAERAPKQNSLDRFETDVSVTLTGLGGLKASLNELRTAAFDLSLSSSFSKRSVTISDKAYFSATATSSANAGEYAIEVQQLAVGSTQQSKVFTGGATTTFGDGTLTFTVGSQTFDVAVSSTDTLEEVRANINAATGNDFVSANLLNNITDTTPDPDETGSVLTFNSAVTGAGNDLVVTYTGDASLADLADNLTQTTPAGDAKILVDGFEATSSTNKFENIVQDVTIDVKKINTLGETETLSVALNTASTKALVTSFVEAFNGFVDVVKELGSAETGQAGLLVGDYTLRQANSQIRNLISTPNSDILGSFNSLSSLGITTTREGKLEINNTTLDAAIESNFEDFGELFSGEQGFATKLKDLVDNYTGSSGVISSREQSLNEQLSQISDDRISLNRRIEALTIRLTEQFATMDAIVAQMNSTQSYIAQQFASLPGFSSKKE
ncbi:flagellar filament capping protein FliD [Aliikangiella sp. IMCC44653]